MNHDACHCMDYRKEICPKKCYRAELTQDYFEMTEKGEIDFPTSWSHFYGTQYCKRVKDGDANG